MNTRETQFKSVPNAATDLGLPAGWLRSECAAGRLPCLRVGKRLLVNVDQVRDALARRAAEGVQHER